MTPNEDRIQALLDRWEYHRDRGESISSVELCREAPELIEEVDRRIGILSAMESFLADGTIVAGAAETREDAVTFRLAGYEILSKIGEGGMGSVYLARQIKLQRKVAIKVLPQNRIQDKAAASRFEREMIAVGALNHDHIVQAHDAGEVNGIHYLVMELVEGANLSDILKSVGPLRIADACELIRQAAVGLQYVYLRGLVHRDIKPSNLMLAASHDPNESPKIKVLDLGLALLNSHHSNDEQMLTSTGQLMGTIDYMSPEQAMDTHQVDIRADIYSLGATLYKLLTGRAPFEDPQNNSMLKRLRALDELIPTPLVDVRSDCPRALSDLIARLLAKSPDERPSQPAQVAHALMPFATGADLRALLHNLRQPSFPSTIPPTTAGFSQHPTPGTTASDRKLIAPAAVRQAEANRSRFRRQIATIVVGIGGFCLLCAMIVFVIGDGKGTVTIEAPEELMESISAIVIRDGHPDDGEFVIKPGKTHHRIRSGRIEIKLPANAEDQFEVQEQGQLIIQRNNVLRLKLVRKTSEPFVTKSSQQNVDPKAADPNVIAIAEPPSLDEWLKGRTILTVAQDGSGQFTSIQAALNSLRQGQVVEVMDRGPYREKLRMPLSAKDTGLISRAHAIIEVPKWELAGYQNHLDADQPLSDTYDSHAFGYAEGFRLSGFDFRYPKSLGKPGDGRIHKTLNAFGSGIIIEDCEFRVHRSTIDKFLIDLVVMDKNSGTNLCMRDNVIEPEIFLTVEGDVERHQSSLLVCRNLFTEIARMVVHSASSGRFTAVQNIFTGRSMYCLAFGRLPSQAVVEIIHNTLDCQQGLLIDRDTKLPQNDVTLKNNLSTGPSLLWVGRLSEPDRHSVVDGWTIRENSSCDMPAGFHHSEWVPRQPLDFPEPHFLSRSPNDPGFLRLTADQWHQKPGGQKGKQVYAGALPPGPAPKEGDWFTRLQARWNSRNSIETNEMSVPKPSTPSQLAYQTREFEAWMREVADLTPHQLIDRVAKKLVELNPGFDGQVQNVIEGGVVTQLRFYSDHVTDISPVRALRSLDTFEAISSKFIHHAVRAFGTGKLVDISPLKGMRLRNVGLWGNSSLTDISPLSGMPLQLLHCGETDIADLSPLRSMKLEKTSWANSRINDLSVFKGMPLTYLTCQNTEVSDLSPLTGTPLKFLACANTGIKSLTPLEGTPLEVLDCSVTAVTDLSPLSHTSLKKLLFAQTRIADISSLRNLPLTEVYFNGTSVTDLSPLQSMELEKIEFDVSKIEKGIEVLRGMTSLKTIGERWDQVWPAAEFWRKYDAGEFGKSMTAKENLPDKQSYFQSLEFEKWAKEVAGLPAYKQADRVVKKLVELNPGFDGKFGVDVEDGMVVRLSFHTDHVTDISPVRALTGLKDLNIAGERLLGDYPNWSGSGKLSDLSPLRGMTLKILEINQNPLITDLSPLHGMPLVKLHCDQTGVSNLNPTLGMHLEFAFFSYTRVADLTP